MEIIERIEQLEKRVSGLEVQYAVINTKLTAIIWLLCAIGTATIGVLIKYIFNF